MEKQRKRIAFDNDEVIVAFVEPFLKFHNGKYGTDIQRDAVEQFHIHHALGVPREVVLQRFDEYYSSDDFKNSPPMEGSVEALHKLAQTHELIMITARPEHIEHLTHLWLDAYAPGLFSSIHHVDTHNRHEAKADLCKKLQVALFVDDNPETIAACIDAGINAILFDAPWNKKHHNIPRAHTWRELVALIEQLEKNDEM